MPNANVWTHKREGAKRVSKVYPTKAAPEAAGRNTPMREKLEHHVQGKDWQVGERTSYGNDPHSIPG
jgi:hypothetical protein